MARRTSPSIRGSKLDLYKGIVSNCMNCHNRAGWRPTDFRPIFRGKPDLAGDPAYKAGQLRTDFLWSLPFEAK